MSHKIRIVVTAGPTREMLDPVRFLSNVSTGEMGYQLAREAKRRGWNVTLVSGPVAIKPPDGIRFIQVMSAEEMRQQVTKYFQFSDVLIMTAAVCDYTPQHQAKHKIRRIKIKRLVFKRTHDILKSISKFKGNRLSIGFCLETRDLVANAVRKLKEKNLDLIVANAYNKKQYPFGKSRLSCILIDRQFRKKTLPKMDKSALSKRLLKEVDVLLAAKAGTS